MYRNTTHRYSKDRKLIFLSFQQNEEMLPWIFTVLAIIFNPIFKIYLPKEAWVTIDIFAGAILLFAQNKLIK